MMDYLELLDLKMEPFANCPDPNLFFPAGGHVLALQKLELAVRLRRGLNVMIGEVGTGKTTLSRKLIARLGNDPGIDSHLILDPSYVHPLAFLRDLAQRFALGTGANRASEWELKEQIKDYLFNQGVNENRTVVVVIDEGQKLPPFGLELLRELLNYETNSYKLLQIVIVAQPEFQRNLEAMPNLADRINLLVRLEPFTRRETGAMIRYRLSRAAGTETSRLHFSRPAVYRIHRLSGGYPRRIIHLCHEIMLSLALEQRHRVGWRQVAKAAALIPDPRPGGHWTIFLVSTAVLTLTHHGFTSTTL